MKYERKISETKFHGIHPFSSIQTYKYTLFRLTQHFFFLTTVHVSIETDHLQAFSTKPQKKQGKILLFVRSLKYYKICITMKL
jgi:hypothetical protein